MSETPSIKDWAFPEEEAFFNEKTKEERGGMEKPNRRRGKEQIREERPAYQLYRREYYERTNELIEQYMYIDCLLDSSIPHDLLNEYNAELEASAFKPIDVPATIAEEPSAAASSSASSHSPPIVAPSELAAHPPSGTYGAVDSNAHRGTNPVSPLSSDPSSKIAQLPPKRTPQDIFRSSENLPLLKQHRDEGEPENPPHATRAPSPSSPSDAGPRPNLPWLEDAAISSNDPVVTVAIWINMIANLFLLAGKLAVVVSVPSMSVLASLVDAVLDFLSTAIVWVTTKLISKGQQDQHHYPVGRHRYDSLPPLDFLLVVHYSNMFWGAIQTGACRRVGLFRHHGHQFCAGGLGVYPATC